MIDPFAPLWAGTADEAARLDHSPAHTWKESRNPGNQWLANLRGAKAHRMAVHNAGVQARLFVRAEFQKAGYPLPPYATHRGFLP